MEQLLTANPTWLLLILVWSLPWKGVALWKAARLYNKGWFIALLVVNSLALLDIFYIFFVAPKQERAWQSEEGGPQDAETA